MRPGPASRVRLRTSTEVERRGETWIKFPSEVHTMLCTSSAQPSSTWDGPISCPDTMNFQLRISRGYNDISDTYFHFANLSKAAFAFRHNPDDGCSREHCHVYMFGYSQSENTARKYLKKTSYYDASGNPDWALSLTCGKGNNARPVDVSGAWLYGTTEHLYPDAFSWRKGISPVRVEELKVLAKHFWCGGVVELNGKSVSKPRNKDEKEDKYKVVEAIREIFKNKHKCSMSEDYDGHWRPCGAQEHLTLLYNIAIKELRARRIRWSMYDLDRYVLPAMDEKSESDFIQEMVKRNLRL